MFKTKEEIKNWLDKHKIINYTINNDLSVDVDGNVYLDYKYTDYKKLIEIPVQFNVVKGNFDCCNNNLTSLKGSPKEVKGHFWCDYNQLTSLKDSPRVVNGSFVCFKNKLTSLKHLPEIHGNLVCDKDLHETREYKIYEIGKKLREMV